MNIKEQHFFSLIQNVKQKKRFSLIEVNDRNFIFDGISFLFIEISSFVKDLINTDNEKEILEKIINRTPEAENNFLTLSIFEMRHYKKPKYFSDDKKGILSLNIGSKCNLDCSYCFRNKNENKKTDFSIVKKSIDYLIDSKKNVDSYSIAMDLSSEIFLERDILKQTVDYIFEKECYLFEEDELIDISPLDFYKKLPKELIENKKISEKDALIEINKVIIRRDLFLFFDNDFIEQERPYLFQQYKMADILPLWKLVKLNHWLLEAFYPEFVKHKEKKYFSIWFMSNGTALNPKDIEIIKGLEINPFMISLDGPENIHNKLRPYGSGKGSYQDVLKSIKLLQENDIKVKISLVITNLYPAPYKLIKFLQSIGAYQVKMTLVRNSQKLELTEESLHILLDEYSVLFRELEQNLINLDFRLFKFLEDDISLRPLQALLNGQLRIKRCLWKEELVIDSTGDIYPCTYACGNKEFLLGNINSSKVKIDLENELFIDKRKKCKDCWARYLCGGTCYYNTYMKEGSVSSCETIECQVNKFFCYHCTKLYLLIKLNKINSEMIFE